MAWVKAGLSDFLFGSFSALCGSKHGILGGPARGMQANGWDDYQADGWGLLFFKSMLGSHRCKLRKRGK